MIMVMSIAIYAKFNPRYTTPYTPIRRENYPFYLQKLFSTLCFPFSGSNNFSYIFYIFYQFSGIFPIIYTKNTILIDIEISLSD